MSNPADDRLFAAVAVRLLDESVTRPEELQRLLRGMYARSVVRRRDLVGEQYETWYVYRDGRWTPSRSQAKPIRRHMSEGRRRDDLRATVDSIAADVHELADLEATKRELDPADPEVRELSGDAERLGRGIHQKTVAELELSEAGGAGEDRRRPD